MKQLIQKYLEDKKLAWADSTLRSEEHRLNGVSEHLNGDANKLWNAIQELSPYSRLTTWSRVCDFWDFLLSENLATTPNSYRAFRKKNAKQFKNVYTPKTPTITFESATQRISTLAPSVRDKAFQLLNGGLRYSESFTTENSQVIGKGGKTRRTFSKEAAYEGCYRTFLRALQSVGLTPHMLRKICATRLAREGLREADLCKVFGWVSFKTASSYIAPIQDQAIQDVFAKIRSGGALCRTTNSRKAST